MGLLKKSDKVIKNAKHALFICILSLYQGEGFIFNNCEHCVFHYIINNNIASTVISSLVSYLIRYIATLELVEQKIW